MPSEQLLSQAAETFFAAYSGVLTDTDDISDTLEVFLDTLVDDPRDPYDATQEVTITFSGKPGATAYFGQFRGQQGIRDAIQGLTSATRNSSVVVDEIIPTSYAIDFTLADPLVPQDNRVAVLFDEYHTAVETGLQYRQDTLALLSVSDDGLIQDVKFYYDAYIPLQALTAIGGPLIANPNLAAVVDPGRDSTVTAEETINAGFGFFGTFAGIDAAIKLIPLDDTTTLPDFSPLRSTVTDDVAFKFSGDPRYLDFATDEIVTGGDELVDNFVTQFAGSRPRTFDQEEWFVKGDRLVVNTFEQRTSVDQRIGYDIQTEIMLTARDGLVSSVEGMFDTTITTAAFTGTDLLPTAYVPNRDKPVVREQADAEFLNLTAYAKAPVQVELQVFSEADFDNTIGVFRVDDVTGLIDGLRPGDEGYVEAALANTLLSFNRGEAVSSGGDTVTRQSLSTTLDGGVILAAYIITNGTVESYLADHSGSGDGRSHAFFTFQDANADGFDHFRLSGNAFQAEDLWGGGDQDYNDMTFAVNVSSGLLA